MNLSTDERRRDDNRTKGEGFLRGRESKLEIAS